MTVDDNHQLAFRAWWEIRRFGQGHYVAPRLRYS